MFNKNNDNFGTAGPAILSHSFLIAFHNGFQGCTGKSNMTDLTCEEIALVHRGGATCQAKPNAISYAQTVAGPCPNGRLQYKNKHIDYKFI